MCFTTFCQPLFTERLLCVVLLRRRLVPVNITDMGRRNIICYGMLLRLPIDPSSGTEQLGVHSTVPANLEGRCVYLKDPRLLHIGHVKKRTACIVRKLTQTDGIDLRFEVYRRRQEQLLSLSQRKRSGKAVLELSIVIY